MVERFYTKAFGSFAAFPETWFDMNSDTLYLDWGWYGAGTVKVKHLAIYQTLQDSLTKDPVDYNVQLCHLLMHFCNLDTLTLVNRRHKFDEYTSHLVFMEPVDLLIWQVYRGSNTTDWDSVELNSCIDRWLEIPANASPITDAWNVRDWHSLEQLRRQWARDRIPPFKKPRIDRKIITTTKTKESLGMIAGGARLAGKLSALSSA